MAKDTVFIEIIDTHRKITRRIKVTLFLFFFYPFTPGIINTIYNPSISQFLSTSVIVGIFTWIFLKTLGPPGYTTPDLFIKSTGIEWDKYSIDTTQEYSHHVWIHEDSIFIKLKQNEITLSLFVKDTVFDIPKEIEVNNVVQTKANELEFNSRYKVTSTRKNKKQILKLLTLQKNPL